MEFELVDAMPPAFDQQTYRRTHPRTEEMRRHRAKYPEQTKRHGKRKRLRKSTFIGVDGEGWNIDDSHEYTMIVTSLPDQFISLGRALTATESLGFLADLPKAAHRLFVSFYFDYDVTMILRDMAIERPDLCDLLFEPGRKKYVWWRGFGIKYRPHKSFTVKRWSNANDTRATVIHDVSSFFQSSFVKALEKFDIGDEELRTRMEAMKDNRSTFTPAQMEEILRYSQEECRCLVELTEQIRDLSLAAGLSPSPYEGPGGLANNAYTIHYGKDRHNATMANMPQGVRDWAMHAMYGGRFETLAVGRVDRPTTEWDLSSAYPSAMLDLPCLVHGKWTRSRTHHSQWSMSFIKFHHDNEWPGIAYPLPIRDDKGGLFYPQSGSGWYWRHEFELDDPEWHYERVGSSWSWVPAGCDCKPFDWIRDLYKQRQMMELAHKGSGIALKLALNTLYGKMAQRKPVPGAWLNMVYASMTTSLTRRKMYDLYQSLPQQSVVMFATDAVFTVQGELPIAEGLGGLERAADYDSIVIVQPGVYFCELGAHFKTRGIPKKVFAKFAHRIRDAAIHGIVYPIEVTNFMGLRLSLHRSWPSLFASLDGEMSAEGMPIMSRRAITQMGQWLTTTRKIDTRPQTKRAGEVPMNGVNWTWARTNDLADGTTKPLHDLFLGGEWLPTTKAEWDHRMADFNSDDEYVDYEVES
jgi:hypothetical protein